MTAAEIGIRRPSNGHARSAEPTLIIAMSRPRPAPSPVVGENSQRPPHQVVSTATHVACAIHARLPASKDRMVTSTTSNKNQTRGKPITGGSLKTRDLSALPLTLAAACGCGTSHAAYLPIWPDCSSLRAKRCQSLTQLLAGGTAEVLGCAHRRWRGATCSNHVDGVAIFSGADFRWHWEPPGQPMRSPRVLWLSKAPKPPGEVQSLRAVHHRPQSELLLPNGVDEGPDD